MGSHTTMDGLGANGDVRALADNVVKDVKELGRDIKGLAGAASEAAQERAREAGAKLSEAGRTVRERATQGAERAAEEVRSHPGAAVGMALGAGVLLGMLIARRR